MASMLARSGVGSFLSPLAVHDTKLELIRNISKMARRCKSGKNKTREIEPSPKKLMIADQVRDIFTFNEMVLVFHFSDMNTFDWEDLRFALGKDEIKVKVVPNKVTCKALEDTIYSNMAPLFLAATCVTYSKEAKVKPLLSAMKKQPKVELLGGKIDNQLLSRNQVIEYSKLPSKTELHGHLLQLLAAPSRRLSTLLQQNKVNLSVNLSQYVAQGDSA